MDFRDLTSNTTNSSMSPCQMKVHCQIDSGASGYLEHAMKKMNFSDRAHDRIPKVARKLADLGGAENIGAADILEAIQYRSLDRKLFPLELLILIKTDLSVERRLDLPIWIMAADSAIDEFQ